MVGCANLGVWNGEGKHGQTGTLTWTEYNLEETFTLHEVRRDGLSWATMKIGWEGQYAKTGSPEFAGLGLPGFSIS